MDDDADTSTSPPQPASSPDPPRHENSSTGNGHGHGNGNGTQPDTLPEVTPIDPAGDLVLDVTFETSRSVHKAARKAAAATALRAPPPPSPPEPALPGSRVLRAAYRVSRAPLRRHSRYFEALLDAEAARFREARDVAAALRRLALRGVPPADAAAAELPRVRITDDDEATRYPAARREAAFADLLRILHGREVAALAAAAVAAATSGGDSGTAARASATVATAAAAAASASPGSRRRSAAALVGAVGSGSAKKAAASATRRERQPQQKQKQQSQQKKTSQQQQPPQAAASIGMPHLVTLAVLADRFDCAAAVSRWLASAGPRVKWPVTSHSHSHSHTTTTTTAAATTTGRSTGMSATTATTATTTTITATATVALRDGDPLAPSMSRGAEEVLRQKILVAWLLDLQVRFQNATRELILNGSCRWSAFGGYEEEEEEGGGLEGEGVMEATWWYLQDGLEQELQTRRHSILNTLASIPQHFLQLYSAAPRARQCKLGYDSSAACDSYQLGEMVRFLLHKNLLALAGFSPRALDALPDAALAPAEGILNALRQCPAYQVDKHHSNCGLRTRLVPILDFVRGLLTAGSVPVSCAGWKRDRAAAAWMPSGDAAGGGGASGGRPWQGANGDAADHDVGPKPFRFTRSLLGDQRLRFEHALGADKFAREVFTASSWDWTADS